MRDDFDDIPGLGFPIFACEGELAKDPRQCIQKARNGSRRHMVTICYAMDTVPKNLKADALTAILPFIKDAETVDALADAINVGVSSLKWLLSTDDNPPEVTSPLENALLCFWDPLVRNLLRRFHKSFFNRETDIHGLNTISLAIYSSFLLGIGRNATLGPKFYTDREMMRLPTRMWLFAMSLSLPGHCLVEVQECFWACFTTKCVDSHAFVDTLIDEAGGDARKVVELSVSELRGNVRDRTKRIKETMNLQIRFNMALLLSPRRDVQFAALDNGAIQAITRAVLCLKRSGEACCTASSIMLFLNIAETILKNADTVRGITDAVEAGLLKVLTESVAFATCTCLREQDVTRISSLLKSFLTQYLVIDSVLDVIVTEMAEMSSTRLIELKRSPFADAWGTLRAATLERAVFKIMLENEARDYGKVAICDFCWRPSPMLNLKKCAGCKTTMYCSAECQRRDWKEFNHKAECKKASDRAYPPLRPNDKYFLSRLAECDIRRHITGLDSGSAMDHGDTPDNELYYAVNYNVNPMTLDVYHLDYLKQSTPAMTLTLPRREALKNGGAKLVEVSYPLGEKTGRFLHVVYRDALRKAPMLKPSNRDAEMDSGVLVKGVPEAWFRSKAIWAIPPAVGSEEEKEESDEGPESDVEDLESNAEGSTDDEGDEDDASNESDENSSSGSGADSDDSSSESNSIQESDSDANSGDNSSATSEQFSSSVTSTPVQRTKDEVDAVLGYMLGACGLACDQKSYERLVSVKYSWRDLEKIVDTCQSSESWPFESDNSQTKTTLSIEAP